MQGECSENVAAELTPRRRQSKWGKQGEWNLSRKDSHEEKETPIQNLCERMKIEERESMENETAEKEWHAGITWQTMGTKSGISKCRYSPPTEQW